MIQAIWLLRVGVAITMVVFGIHQIINPSDWFDYLPEFMKKMSPTSLSTQMRMHALGNIAFGLFLVAGSFHPLLAAWVALVWWVVILPFGFMKKWDIGMRDLTIVLSILALIHLLK